MLEELLPGIDDAGNLAPDLFARLDLTNDLIDPLFGYVAVRTGRPYTRSVAVMDRLFQFDEDVITHFMAADTERLLVGFFQSCIEAAPEDNPRDKAAQQ